METVGNWLTKFHDTANSWIGGYVQLSSVLSIVAAFLCFQALLALVFWIWPRAKSNLFFRKLNCLMWLTHILLFFTVFFLIDSFSKKERTITQNMTLATFCILLIGLICYVVWNFGIGVFILFRHRSIKLALAGSRSFIINNGVYPVDCYQSVIVITKQISSGFTEYKFGEHCIDTLPTDIVYKSVFTTENYTYHSTVNQGSTTVYIFKSTNHKGVV